MAPQESSDSRIKVGDDIFRALEPLESTSSLFCKDVSNLRTALLALSKIEINQEKRVELHEPLAAIIMWSEALGCYIKKSSPQYNDDNAGRGEYLLGQDANAFFLGWCYQNRDPLVTLRRCLTIFIRGLRDTFARIGL
jgi:hypothetical protein